MSGRRKDGPAARGRGSGRRDRRSCAPRRSSGSRNPAGSAGVSIEFKNDAGEATGRKVYLQLKSGDSYLKKRKSDGAEIFRLHKERHACYWMDQQFPVLLVVRTSDGAVRWMEVRDWLKRATDGGKKRVRQIVFEGERFDVMSVRRWRERALRAD